MIPIAKPIIGEEEIEEVRRVLLSGYLIQGNKVRELEKKFADYVNSRSSIAVNSGTSALHTALLACGVKRGDEVITTPFSFISSANAILFCNARPVFVDIDPETFNINPDLIEEKITEKTKAILPVHLYGMPAEMNKIIKIAKEHGLLVIEDACQAHGAEYKERKVGNIGNAACFSFYPTKNIVSSEGGIITTNDDKISKSARMIRNHGQEEIGDYLHRIIGFNYRMSDIQAAIALKQLEKLDYFTKKRIENAHYLDEGLKDVDGILIPKRPRYVRHVFHQYTIRVLNEKRDLLAEKLRIMGIQTKVYYPVAIYNQPVYRNLGYDEHLPEAEKASKEVLSLPVHPSLTIEDLNKIISSVKSIMEKL